ncbi:hypothetical protein [Herbidospora cretacea]|uniref:hypothetical protein n=1 Tax=Herbidospora cretacea TaxID=28444 RepID=UPI000A56B8E2|nr:hypothetical protein [Herbidospora cretacea]
MAENDDHVPPRRSVGERGKSLFLPASSLWSGRAIVLSMGLTLLFSALMLPAWLHALASLGPHEKSWAIGLGVAYTIAYLLFVAIGRWEAWIIRAVLCLILMGLGAALVVLLGLDNSWVLMFALCVIAVMVRREVAAVATSLALVGLAVGALLA